MAHYVRNLNIENHERFIVRVAYPLPARFMEDTSRWLKKSHDLPGGYCIKEVHTNEKGRKRVVGVDFYFSKLTTATMFKLRFC